MGVGGFAAMAWVEAPAYAAAGPDPLSEVAPGIVEHMNRDHADALALFARVLAGEAAEINRGFPFAARAKAWAVAVGSVMAWGVKIARRPSAPGSAATAARAFA